jgi:acetyl-CoA C-acetyltransferase
MAGSYIVAGARTPIGKMSGALASFSAADLGGFAIKAALERAGVAPDEVEHVIMGQVLMAGQGQVPSRQAASQGRHPDERAVDQRQQGLPQRPQQRSTSPTR